MTSASSVGTATVVTATLKPWFLTFDPESKDVFIWKNGLRMKLRDGSSSGRVTAVRILSASEKTVTLMGLAKDGSQRFRFHCHLSAFEKDANNFTKELSTYLSDPHQFCMKLNKATDGIIENGSGPSSQQHSSSKPSYSQEHRKRARGNKAQSTGSKKKKKRTQEDQSSVQEEIDEHEIGVFNLPIDALRDPPPYLRVREVKEWYVEYLAEMLLQDEGDHENLTAPLLVVASAGKDDFRQKNMNSYTYEVIGGIQRFTAITRVNNRAEGCKITTRKCAVYGSGLSRSASLVLARQHNEFNQIQRTTSFPEIAACCRRLLFSHFAMEDELNDTDTMPVVPRYNTQAYRLFKQECLTFLVSSQVSLPMVEQAIQMALLPSPIYHKLQSVFTLYEDGKLKGQKARQMTGLNLQKAIEGKFAPKLSQFKVFQGLQDQEKEELLDGLLAGTLSFGEVEKRSEELKTFNTTKEAFLKEVQLETWKEAEATIPKFAHMNKLKKFKVQKGKALPKSFLMFCDKARAAKQYQAHRQSDAVHIASDGGITIVAMNPDNLIMECGSTPYVGMARKKNGLPIKPVQNDTLKSLQCA